jgi:hypothetical protein
MAAKNSGIQALKARLDARQAGGSTAKHGKQLAFQG